MKCLVSSFSNKVRRVWRFVATEWQENPIALVLPCLFIFVFGLFVLVVGNCLGWWKTV